MRTEMFFRKRSTCGRHKTSTYKEKGISAGVNTVPMPWAFREGRIVKGGTGERVKLLMYVEQ